MRFLMTMIVGVSVTIAPVSTAQAQPPPNDFSRFLSVRQEVAQAGALAAVDPEAALGALQRAVAGLSRAGDAAAQAEGEAGPPPFAQASPQPADYAAVVDLALQLDAPAEMRKTLADGWLDRVSGDEAFRAAMTHGQLLKLGRLVKAAGPQRLDAVIAIAAQRAEQLQALPEPSVLALCDVMEALALGGVPAADGLEKKLQGVTTAKHGRFSKELAPFEVVRLAEYSTASGKAEAAERLRAFVVREYLAEPGIAAAMRLSDWSDLLGLLADSRDDALRQAMVTVTVQRAGAALQGSRRETAAAFLRKVEQSGGSASEVNALAAKWMGVEPGSTDVAAIRALLEAADDQAVRAAMVATMGLTKNSGDDREAMAAAVEAAVTNRDQAVTAAMKSLRDRHDAGKLDAAGYALACRLARESGSAAAAEFWSQAAMERFLQSKGNGDDALVLLEASASAGFTFAAATAGADSPSGDASAKKSRETAIALKLLARLAAFRDDSWRISDAVMQSLAQAFDQAGMAETLYKSISLPDGSGPDFIAVKLLAWIRRDQQKIRPFIGELAAPTEKTRGDIRARWELARAYAVSLVEPRAPRRTDGNGHIRLALQASRGDATLLMCLEELLAASRPTHSYTFPLQIITSMKDRFDGDMRRRLDQMEQQIRSAMPTANAAGKPTANTTGKPTDNTTAKPTGDSKGQPANQPNWQTIFDQKRQQMQRG